MSEALTQTELLEAAKAGDEAALAALLEAVQPQLFRFSMKMCRHTEDAEDVLQDTLLTMARSVGSFRGGSSLSTWLYSIARSVCIKKRRKSRFAPETELPLETAITEPASGPDPERAASTAQVWQQVQHALQHLDPAQREILVLRDVEGLSANEVAEITQLSVGAVKGRLHRARGKLRELLAGRRPIRRPGCPDIHRIFSEHLEGDLSPQICATMEAHVAECSHCADECDGLKTALHACSSAPCEVPEPVRSRVQAALKAR